jgi:hypothetical protein
VVGGQSADSLVLVLRLKYFRRSQPMVDFYSSVITELLISSWPLYFPFTV